MSENKYSVLNTRVHNVDGHAKVTGRATYTFDVTLPGMLYGKILRSPHPHAKIVSIDYSEALKLPGVITVVTGKEDTLGVRQGIWRRYKDLCDEAILTVDKVRYIGEPVAAVAAVTEEIAEQALDLINVEYEVLPFVDDPMEAIKKEAPLIHEGFERNVNVTRQIAWGDLEDVMEEAEYVREDWFKLGGQHHMCMETRAAVANYTPDGKLTIYTSTQSAYYHQALLAGVLGLREGNIRVLAPYVGGGFGGKFELDGAQFCASILSMKCCKPVKVIFSREEDFIASKRRTPMYYYVRTGVKKDGTFCAREAKVFTNGGAYTGMGATALYLTGFFHSFPYRWKAYRYDGYRVYTNSLPSTSMRGFGAPQAMFCSEQQIEWIANDLGLDPIEMRRKNGHYEGYEVPGQATIASCGLDEALTKIQEWKKSKGKLPANRAIGISAAGFMSGGIFNWFDSPYSFSSAVITINHDGTVELHVGAQEIGQGSSTTLAMICAEALGVKLEDVKVHMGDTDHSPADLGAWGSRQTLMAGNATKMAAQDAKRQLLEFANAKLGFNIIYDLDIKQGWVYNVARPERGMSYYDLCKEALRGKEGQRIIGRGFYTPRRKGMISPAYSYMVQGLDVEIDPETGYIKIHESVTAHDCGQPINTLGLIGQLEGAASMAIGFGYYEYLPVEDGKIMNPNLVDYKLIRAPEMPACQVIEIDTYEPEGPYGAKEAGEGLTNPHAAALGNAIFYATGLQMKEAPIRAEAIAKAWKEQQQKKNEKKK
ncbi:MAG TPA: molybdopterin cofactor-binding domain-containing protein [Syntrophorhabdales bacterium]|nr:molybdopterin cofactor-binding domain-containing protein [Syntrophorhabdales bacterium]